MKFFCSHCGQRLEATEQCIGQPIDCPICGHTFVLSVSAAALPARRAAPQTQQPGPPAQARLRPPPVRSPRPPTAIPYQPTKKRQGAGFGKLLLFLLIFAVVGYGFAMYHFDESPQQVWKRLVGGPETSVPPAPEPTPAPAETPALALKPKAMPASTPEFAPTSSQPDAFTWLLGHKDYWPQEVALLKEADFPAVVEGRVAGSVTMPPGTLVKLVELSGETASVTWRGGATRVPIAATDLRERAKKEMAKAAAAEAAPTVSPALTATDSTPPPGPPFPVAGNTVPMTISSQAQTEGALSNRRVTLTGSGTLRLTGAGDPLTGSVINFASPDAWLFLEKVRPSAAAATLLNRMWVNGSPATLDVNVRVVQYGSGCAVIPQGLDFAAMQVFGGSSFGGSSMPLRCGVKYNDESLGAMKTAIRSFRLKRGYMATIAQEENGTGISKNYVAQDHDIEVKELPPELDRKIRFVRVFPWRWTSKKGVAGGIWQNLNVSWYYNWNLDQNSTLELEYVPIRQKRWWPSLNQDWVARGATHLLGYNEPDHKDQSNLNVGDAISSWPDLLGTGLRLGSPAVSDGGLNWLYEFIGKADAAKLRVDFVAVHYYRAVNNPADARGAASQFYNFLKGIHDRVKRPLWVTEWNNGANWTGHEPTYEQEKAAVEEMIKMLDNTPFVERYAIYNWVKDVRNVQRKDGSLTPAGEVYRDKVSPLSYIQAKP
jgi:hypothetical protein